MTDFLSQYNLTGIVIGFCTFLIIGLFHPLVIKGEYRYGPVCRWWFLVAGVVTLIACIFIRDVFWSTLLGVTAFSCFWSIKEVNDQRERVRKGWFPKNPNKPHHKNL